MGAPRRTLLPWQREHVDRLVLVPAPFWVCALREIRNAHERPIGQPAQPLERPILDLAVLGARKFVRVTGTDNRPVAESQRADPETRGLLRENRDAVPAERNRRVVFEPYCRRQL